MKGCKGHSTAWTARSHAACTAREAQRTVVAFGVLLEWSRLLALGVPFEVLRWLCRFAPCDECHRLVDVPDAFDLRPDEPNCKCGAVLCHKGHKGCKRFGRVWVEAKRKPTVGLQRFGCSSLCRLDCEIPKPWSYQLGSEIPDLTWPHSDRRQGRSKEEDRNQEPDAEVEYDPDGP